MYRVEKQKVLQNILPKKDKQMENKDKDVRWCWDCNRCRGCCMDNCQDRQEAREMYDAFHENEEWIDND